MINVSFHGIEQVVIEEVERNDGSLFTAITFINKSGNINLFPKNDNEIKEIVNFLQNYLKGE